MNLPELLPSPPQGSCRLAAWGVIRARGADAAKFLHGQLTQDIETMAEGSARLAGYCSAKGRLLATFVVWRTAPEEILLACSADLLPATLKRLSMFVMRARCTLNDASADWPLWGLAGDAAAATLGLDPAAASWQCTRLDAADWIRLPGVRIGDVEVPRWLGAGPQPSGPDDLPAGAWEALEVLSGVPRVVAATVEQFVPQMVNLELVGGVNFKKGCYPGQEVVARSQYRGTLKRRAQILCGAAELTPGQEVFSASDPGQPAGMVALAGSWPALGTVALTELKLAALDGGTLHAGSAQGPLLRVLPLPYALPADAD